jgi:hypothetical protein
MSQDQVQHTVSRPPAREYDENNSCDFFSYAYLSLAFFLFLCGSGLTFLVLRSDQTPHNPLTRFWMAGPLFICTGLLVALKVLLYVRRKRLIALLIREMTRNETWGQVSPSISLLMMKHLIVTLYTFFSLQDQNQSRAIIFERSSLSSIVSLPPAYDVATQSLPPSYEEAVALKPALSSGHSAAASGRRSSKSR